MRQEHPDDLDAARAIQERRGFCVIRGVGVRAASEERANRCDVAVQRGEMEQCIAAAITGVDFEIVRGNCVAQGKSEDHEKGPKPT